MDVAVHVGTLLSVLIYFHKDIWMMLSGLARTDSEGFQLSKKSYYRLYSCYYCWFCPTNISIFILMSPRSYGMDDAIIRYCPHGCGSL